MGRKRHHIGRRCSDSMSEELINKLEDVYGYRTVISNIAFVNKCGVHQDEWVLVDAGLPFSGSFIKNFGEKLFGKGKKPIAIVLTHAHFDHVGGLSYLLDEWKIPVYVHAEELPYVIGQENYPPPHPFIKKGLMSFISPIYPRKAIDIRDFIRILPENGIIPEMPNWKWIHTPGHTKGHVSLFREHDRVLLAGDAFITVKQESALAVLTQKKQIHGPPAYFTFDWERAYESIQKINELKPRIAYTGHGKPMVGQELRKGLSTLENNMRHEYPIGEENYVH